MKANRWISIIILSEWAHYQSKASFFDPVWIVGMHVFVCVCLHPRLLITNGELWLDMDLLWLVKQVLQLVYGNWGHYC